MEWIEWLVLVHVLSAIIGIGPTFAFHIILRKNQSVSELKNSIKTASKLELFPKIGGTLAVLSGLALFFVEDYGSFTQLWLIGSLILYIVIQIIVIGFVSPLIMKLEKWVDDPANHNLPVLPSPQASIQGTALNLLSLASVLGILLFVLMIMKPS